MKITRKMQAALTMRRHALELARAATAVADAAGVAGGAIPGEAMPSPQARRDQLLGELHTLSTLVALVQADWDTYDALGRRPPKAHPDGAPLDAGEEPGLLDTPEALYNEARVKDGGIE